MRLDRKRPKKTSNKDWKHPHDPDARIVKMKDGRTHMAHKVEQAVDLETGAVVAVTVQGTDQGDTTTMIETLTSAAEQVEKACGGEDVLREVVADKAYHSTERVEDLKNLELRSCIRNRIVAAGAGRAGPRLGMPSTATGAASAEGEDSASCDDAPNMWNGPLLTSSKPVECEEAIFEAGRIFSSAF